MGAEDAVSIEYFEDEERYADLINTVVFGGDQVVGASDIREKDRAVTRVLKSNDTKRTQKKSKDRKIQKIERDIIRSVRLGTKVFFVSSELQTNIHYAMPVRVFNEDAAGYLEQWKEARRRHRKEKDVEGEEFLSGFSRRDKLIPQITLVLYFGKREWDGPRSLKDMLDLEGLPEPLEKWVADYPMYLVEVRKFPHLERFRTDIRYVFGFLANAQDKAALRIYVDNHRDFFSDVNEEAYDMISEMSQAEELRTLPKKRYRTETGGIDMCEGLQGMLEDSREEGREEGRKEGREEGREEGRKEGREEGREEGRKEGRKEGHEEGIMLAKTVFRLSAQGLQPERIAAECRVSVDEVEKILRD